MLKFSDKFYDIMKYIALIALPAFETFTGVTLSALDVPTDIIAKVITIISALSAFIGTLIGISSASYNKEK